MKQESVETKSPYLSLIVPFYRQEKTCVRNIYSLHQALKKTGWTFELIAVVDGKNDPSYTMLRKIPKKIFRLYSYSQHEGKAYALRYGITKASGQNLMFIDAGMEIDPAGIRILVDYLEWYQADIVVGSKRHPASHIQYPFIRKILSIGYYFLVKLLFNIKVTDTQAGIKVFRQQVLRALQSSLQEKKFAGDLELLVLAYKAGYRRIIDAPIRLEYKAGSLTSAATWKSIIGIMRDTCTLFIRTKWKSSAAVEAPTT